MSDLTVEGLLVPKNKIRVVWPQAEKLLADAIEQSRGKIVPENLYSFILSPYGQLWMANTKEPPEFIMAMVTQICAYHSVNVLRVIVAGGKCAKAALPIMKMVEEFALQEGCGGIEVSGRVGWKKLLAPYEFKQEAIILYKDLREELDAYQELKMVVGQLH